MAWHVERWREIAGLEQGFGGRGEPRPDSVVTLKQAHGREVRLVSEVTSAETSGDGLILDRAGRAGVWTADCVPVHLVARRARIAAAVHCGWRGSAAGILGETLARLRERFGVRPAEVEAALGPSIGGCCYEVGSEVRSAFRARAGEVLGAKGFEERGGRLFLDLRTFLTAELEGYGLAAIDRVGPCTACHTDLLHSYRREPGTRGRQLSWIGWNDGPTSAS